MSMWLPEMQPPAPPSKERQSVAIIVGDAVAAKGRNCVA